MYSSTIERVEFITLTRPCSTEIGLRPSRPAFRLFFQVVSSLLFLLTPLVLYAVLCSLTMFKLMHE